MRSVLITTAAFGGPSCNRLPRSGGAGAAGDLSRQTPDRDQGGYSVNPGSMSLC